MANKAEKSVKVKLVKSLNGCLKDQIATAYALGLRKIGNESIQPDNAATRGKINKICHLVVWTEA